MTYSPDYFTARESWRDWRIEANALLDAARVARGARVLDLGCGGGGLLRLAQTRGAFAIGVDTLDVALNLARNREGARGREGEEAHVPRSPALPLSHSTKLARIAEDGMLPFRSRTFDALLAQHVIEHINDLDAALREWARVLKPGGRIALATPNAHYPDPAHFADADHAHIFSSAELRDAFVRAGWRIEMCHTIFPYLAPGRVARAFGVLAYRIFTRAPYYATRGRTILLAAANTAP